MRCLKCCKSKKIQVNSYEVARMARNLGISTTEFIDHYTTENGSYLKSDGNNSCIFLSATGCMVHSDRPLVCRLYPLGRHLNEKGVEWFSEVEPEPGCCAVYGGDSSIQTYLDEQETQIYLDAANSYLRLLWEMMILLENCTEEDECSSESKRSDGEANSLIENANLMDMDCVVRNYCLERSMPFPPDVEEKTRMHQNALQFWIKQS
jgi:hypothetical protein